MTNSITTESKRYFERNAKRWVLDGYGDDGYNYPVARQRARIVSNFVSTIERKALRVLDLGCGAGDVSFRLAELGHTVIGIDRSKSMLALAKERGKRVSKSVRSRVSFRRASVEDLDSTEVFDVIVAMGLIGYLPNDDRIFVIANNHLRDGGHFLVSCRNRLFNMISISFRTRREIREDAAMHLLDEIENLYAQVPSKETNMLIDRVRRVSAELPSRVTYGKRMMLSPSERVFQRAPRKGVEARQQTPKQIDKIAKRHGFKQLAIFGVHPHLLDPNLNRRLPPQIFNRLSSILEVLEHLPISLVWSSAFISAFEKVKSVSKARSAVE